MWHYFVTNANPLGIGNDGRYCVYRSQSGNKCAIGVLIPDEEYKESFDGGSTGLGGVQSAVSTLKSLDFGFISELRSAHDTASRWRNSTFKSSAEAIANTLSVVAERFELTIPDERDLQG